MFGERVDFPKYLLVHVPQWIPTLNDDNYKGPYSILCGKCAYRRDVSWGIEEQSVLPAEILWTLSTAFILLMPHQTSVGPSHLEICSDTNLRRSHKYALLDVDQSTIRPSGMPASMSGRVLAVSRSIAVSSLNRRKFQKSVQPGSPQISSFQHSSELKVSPVTWTRRYRCEDVGPDFGISKLRFS